MRCAAALYLVSLGSGCFAPKALVTMADGSTKEIADIRIGDELLSWDQQSKLAATSVVMALPVFPRAEEQMVEIVLQHASILATEDHRLWSRSSGLGSEVASMKLGEQLETEKLEAATVTDIRRNLSREGSEETKVVCLTVQPHRWFYVQGVRASGGGEGGGLLVHRRSVRGLSGVSANATAAQPEARKDPAAASAASASGSGSMSGWAIIGIISTVWFSVCCCCSCLASCAMAGSKAAFQKMQARRHLTAGFKGKLPATLNMTGVVLANGCQLPCNYTVCIADDGSLSGTCVRGNVSCNINGVVNREVILWTEVMINDPCEVVGTVTHNADGSLSIKAIFITNTGTEGTLDLIASSGTPMKVGKPLLTQVSGKV